jgi:HSP20 family molecular chaperone IbpA
MPRAAKGKTSAQENASFSRESTSDYVGQWREIQQAIACRAYELFENRDRVPGHDLEDWLRAEQDILLHIAITIDDFDDKLVARASVPLPKVDDLEVHVQDQHIIIRDRGPICVEDASDGMTFKRVFHAVSLPEPVDWASAGIAFENGVLEIVLPKLTGDDFVEAA